MKDDRYIELINKEISGDITPREMAELSRYLSDYPDARKMRRELHRASELLSEVGDVEPPPHLKHHIMNSVDFSRYRTKARQPVMEFLGRVRHLSLRPRLAYAFAAGVAFGLVLFSVLLSDSWDRYSPDLGDLYATIGVGKDADFRRIERLPLDLPEVSGRVDLMRSADLLILDVSLASTRPYEVRVLYDPAEARFNGLLPESGWKSLAEVGDGWVSTSGSGEGRFHLSLTKLEESALPVGLEVVVSDQVVLSHRFNVAPRDEQRK
jgi:hypothetical protein